MCYNLNHLAIEAGNKKYKTLGNGWGITDEKYKIIYCGSRSIDWSLLPKSIERVDDYAFYGRSLAEPVVQIPNHIHEIGELAFAYTNIRSLSFKKGVRSIGFGAFMECANLKNITFCDGIKTIETGAFDGCYMIENITFGKGIVNCFRPFRWEDMLMLRSLTFPSKKHFESYTHAGERSLHEVMGTRCSVYDIELWDLIDKNYLLLFYDRGTQYYTEGEPYKVNLMKKNDNKRINRKLN